VFIDIHVHTNPRPAPLRENGAMTYASPEYLIRRYDVIQVEKAVILPEGNPECNLQLLSEEQAMDIVARHPDRFVAFCNVDPRMGTNDEHAPLQRILEYHKSQGFKGCGEVCANLPFDDPRMENLFRACEKTRMPLTFHVGPKIGGCYGVYDEPGLPRLEKALRKFPNLIFLGHSQAFWAEIAPLSSAKSREGYPTGRVRRPGRVVQLMRRYPNLHGDLSAGSGHNAVSRDEEFGLRFFQEFQDRLYFGTDICHPDTDTPLVDYLLKLRAEKKLPEATFRKIARENAVRLLGL
jgi:uncharacterized protein